MIVVRAIPSPMILERRLVFSRARCSSFSSRLASSASAISGATTSRRCRPRRRSSLGRKSVQYSTILASASASRSGSRSSGSASRACTTTWACAADTIPSAIPAATWVQVRSTASASRASLRAAGVSIRVRCASQAPTSLAPACSAASPAAARTRSFSSAVCASSRVISVIASACWPVVMNIGCTSRTPSSASPAARTAPVIGCWVAERVDGHRDPPRAGSGQWLSHPAEDLIPDQRTPDNVGCLSVVASSPVPGTSRCVPPSSCSNRTPVRLIDPRPIRRELVESTGNSRPIALVSRLLAALVAPQPAAQAGRPRKRRRGRSPCR